MKKIPLSDLLDMRGLFGEFSKLSDLCLRSLSRNLPCSIKFTTSWWGIAPKSGVALSTTRYGTQGSLARPVPR